MGVYIYQSGIETPMQNAYIGEHKRTPDASRTLLYYEFENNLSDSSGNGNNITGSSSIGYQQVGGQYVSYITSGSGYLQCSPTVGSSIGSGDFTISFWIYPKQPASNKYPMMFGIFDNSYPYTGPNIFFDPYNIIGGGDKIQRRTNASTQAYGATSASSLYNGWHHLVMTRNSGTVTCYLDTNVEATWNGDTNAFPTSSNSSGYVLFSNNGSSQQWGVSGVKGDKVILEKVGWSSQDVTDYYNQTKSKYEKTVLFNFGDWTNSQWSEWWSSQGTITKTANSIMFSIGSNYSTNYLSQYPIDGTKDFLLEFNANIPSTSVGTHCAGLYNPNISILFQTAWQSSYRNKMRCVADGQYVADGGANPGTADYFIKKEGNVLTMGWNNTTVYTDNNYSFESEYYLCEQVYNDTLTIYTAKLTYL